jgi:polyhydroxybutyrate depolymerase
MLVAIGCPPDGVVGGRPYALVVPKQARAGEPLPLVMLLHGFSANGPLQEWLFDLSSAVEEEGYLLAIPNGEVDEGGRRFWNGAEGCCQPEHLEVDDVAYLRAVIDDVRSKHPVDPRRIFLVGHSNGGFMALRMACEASDLVTGVVSVAGAAFDDFGRCPSGSRVPVLQLHGTKDGTIAFGGGATSYGAYPSAEETTRRFAARNGCSTERAAMGRLDLVDGDGDETLREPYTGCPPSGAVELWRMEGVGHIPDFHDRWANEVFGWLQTAVDVQ